MLSQTSQWTSAVLHHSGDVNEFWLLRALGGDCSGSESVNRSRVVCGAGTVHPATPWHHRGTTLLLALVLA